MELATVTQCPSSLRGNYVCHDALKVLSAMLTNRCLRSATLIIGEVVDDLLSIDLSLCVRFRVDLDPWPAIGHAIPKGDSVSQRPPN